MGTSQGNSLHDRSHDLNYFLLSRYFGVQHVQYINGNVCSIDSKPTGEHSYSCSNLRYLIKITPVGLTIRESVDSLCRDGADAQYMQYLRKSRITSPQIR